MILLSISCVTPSKLLRMPPDLITETEDGKVAGDNSEILEEEADHGLLLHAQVLCIYREESGKPVGDQRLSRSILAASHSETYGPGQRA